MSLYDQGAKLLWGASGGLGAASGSAAHLSALRAQEYLRTALDNFPGGDENTVWRNLLGVEEEIRRLVDYTAT